MRTCGKIYDVQQAGSSGCAELCYGDCARHNGDIVEFGEIGTLKPSFKSRAVPKGQKFLANVHIEKPMVRLVPSKKYFTLTDVTYELIEKPVKLVKP